MDESGHVTRSAKKKQVPR